MPEKPPKPNPDNEYVKLENNPEEEGSLSRKATSYTLKKMEKAAQDEKNPKTWEEDLGAKTEKEGDEKIKEKIREVLRELAVHGKIELNEKGEVVIKAQTDLDGKVALGLIKHNKYGAGIEISNKDVDFINPGTFKPGKVTLDSGNKHGVQVFETDKGEVSMIIDHHGDESGRDTSASKLTYELLTQSGLLEKTPALDRLIEFVTHEDNKTLPLDSKDYPNRYKTIAGIGRSLTFGTLHNFFKAGLSPTEELTEEEIEKHRLERIIKQEKKNTERSLKRLEQLEKQGFVINSQRYGKIVVDIGKTVPGGIDAAEYHGAGTYINWSPSTQGFFITSPEKGVQDTFNQKGAITVRGTMYMKPLANREPLTITLKEVLEKMTDGKLQAEGKLKEYLENENRDLFPHENNLLSHIAKTRKEKEEKFREDIGAAKKVLAEANEKFKAKTISEKEFDAAKQSYEETAEELKEEFNRQKGILIEAQNILIIDPAQVAKELFLEGFIEVSDLEAFKEDVKKSQKINSCQSFEDLYKVLEEIGDITDSQGNKYTSEQLKTVIEEYRKMRSPSALEPITRNLGLRDKVQRLAKTQEAPPKSTIKTPGTNNETRLSEIHTRLGEIKEKLMGEILSWKVTDELWKERDRLEAELKSLGYEEKEPELTLKEIDRQIAMAKATARSRPGVTERGLAYWEWMRKEFLKNQNKSSKETLQKEKFRTDPEVLKKINEQLQIARDTFRIPGVTDRGEAYWMHVLEEYLAGRMTAEEIFPSRVVPPPIPQSPSPTPSTPETSTPSEAPEISQNTPGPSQAEESPSLDLPLQEPAVESQENKEDKRINKLLAELDELDKDILNLNREMRFMSPPQKVAAEEEIKSLNQKKVEKEKELEKLTPPSEKGIGLAFKNWVKRKVDKLEGESPKLQPIQEEVALHSLATETPTTSESVTPIGSYEDRLQERLNTNNIDLLHELALEALEVEKLTGLQLTSREISEAIDACFIQKIKDNEKIIDEILSNVPVITNSAKQELRFQLEEAREPIIAAEHNDFMAMIKDKIPEARKWSRVFATESIEKTALRWLGYRFIKPDRKAQEPQYTSEKIWDIAIDILTEKGIRNPSEKAIRMVAVDIASENQVTLINPKTKAMLRPQPEEQKPNNKLLKAGLFKVTRAIIQANKIASKPL